MTTYYETFLSAFICALANIFEVLHLNTDFLADRDSTEDKYLADIKGMEASLLEEDGIECLNAYKQRASDMFNSLLHSEKKLRKEYNSSSAESQEAIFFGIIYYIMRCITYTSSFDFAFKLMSIGMSAKNPYKVRMLLAALDEAEKKIRCA